MSDQLDQSEMRRRKRYSFDRPEQITARATLRRKLKEAGLDGVDAPKTVPAEGEVLIRRAERMGLASSTVETRGSDVAGSAGVQTVSSVGDRPALFAHSRTKRIDAEHVIKLAAIGCTNAEIGVYFGVDGSTISRRFVGSLQKGRALRKRLLRQKQTEVALAGNAGMLIWLGKNELGQRDKPLETNGTSDGPVSLIAFCDAIRAERRRRGL